MNWLKSFLKAMKTHLPRGGYEFLEPLNNFTPRAQQALALAAKEARALNHTYVGTEPILLGLLREGDGVASRVLKNLGVDIEATRQHILRELDPNFSPTGSEPTVSQKPEPPKPPSDAVDI